jgi:DNA-binding beta-propeller fold protein YncE
LIRVGGPVTHENNMRMLATIASIISLVNATATGHVQTSTPGATGTAIALLADGTILAIDVASGSILADHVRSDGPRSELKVGRLAHVPGTDRVFAMLPDGTAASLLAAFDLRTLLLQIVGRLPADQYPGLAVGPRTGRIYAFGSVGSTVLVIDPADGQILRRYSDGSDRTVFSGAVSADERRIYVSYHGNASGVHGFDLADGASGTWRHAISIESHGHFAVVGDTILAATGDQALTHLDRTGRPLGSVPTHLHGNHLMEFALDAKRRIFAVGSCLYNGGFSRTSLEPGAVPRVLVPVGRGARRRPVPHFEVCGERISAPPDGTWIATAPLRETVWPVASRSGSILIVDTATGVVIRTIETRSEVVDVLALQARKQASR